MGALYEYRSWLTKLERQPTFLNNYWCAMLANDMEENKNSEGFKTPYFIVEKELMREDNNVHLKSKDDVYVSPALRQWLIHLLKAHNETTNITNYEEILREVLERKILLPVAQPLSPSSSFHCLPSECKLWILFMLWSRSKPTKPVRSISNDPLGNSYFIVPCCRLYVSMATMDVTSLPIEESRLICEPWGPLYRFVYNQPCRLLCENQEGWSVVLKTLQHFNLTNLCYTLLPDITAKLTEQHLIMTMRDEQRRAFDESLSKLVAVPEGAEKMSKKQMKKLKKEAAALEENAAVKSLRADLKAMTVKESSAAVSPNDMNSVSNQPNEKIGKCWSFPQCPYKNTCQYTHPKLPCTKFPNCKSGWKCLFLHEFCPIDANCKDVNCAYEHVHSQPTFYRAKRDTEDENVRPVASVPPTVRKVSNQTAKKDNEQVVKSPTPATAPPNNQSGEKRRCLYYPKWCKKGNSCEYFHPYKMCKRQAEGKKCAGQRCLYLHGPCKKDGSCTDLKCIFDHYKSTPVIERKLALEKQGGHTRTTSMSSISTVHTQGRRKSVSFDTDSDSDSDDSSAEKKPFGILKTPAAAAKERCHFGARCTKIRCDYTHPKEKCPAFPKCPNGGACIYLHDVCKKDGVCTKEDCDYEHYLAKTVRNRWCNKGSRCQRVDCTYLHPKTCTGRCPTPGNCWMRHLNSSAAASEAKTNKPPKQEKKAESKTPQPNPKRERQSKAAEASKKLDSKPPTVQKKKASAATTPANATPASPQVPQHAGGYPPTGPPPLVRYGFGPDSTFRPGPGYPGYGPGPVPLFPPGYGGYGPGGYYPPPGAAAPPVMFPPPPPPYISREDREMLERKERST